MARLPTHLVEKPWGVERLPDGFAAANGRRIGEIWFEEAQAREAPLLVKYIFTSEKLSVQVHPDNAQARARGLRHGKSECWYIVSAEPSATLGIGTSRRLSPAELRAAAEDGSIEALMEWRAVSPGDFVFIPAGTVHAIGPGIGLVEVQQNIDVTYRLYDYGRPRALHLDDAVAVAATGPHASAHRVAVEADRSARLPGGGDFVVHHLSAREPAAMPPGDGPLYCVPLAGQVRVDGEVIAPGDCATAGDPAAILLDSDARCLVARATQNRGD
jgi:mannose-6-phosphate isomerase